MAVTPTVLFQGKYAESTDTTQYTSPAGVRTIVDKFTAYNSGASSVTLTVNLAPTAGVGASTVVTNKQLAAGETYTFPEIVGHVLSPTDVFSTRASTASQVVIRASGRAVT